MKKLRLAELGFSSIFVLVGMLLVAIALPMATKLVQQNQENRSNAAAPTTGCSKNYVGAKKCSGSELWKCQKIVTSIPGSGGATSTTYDWRKEGATCKYGCANGACKECSTSSYPTKCEKGTKYWCDSGKKKSTKCTYGCDGNACSSGDSCKHDGVTYRNGNGTCWDAQMHTCSNGNWKDGSKCASGECSGNSCKSASTTPVSKLCSYDGKSYNKNQLLCIDGDVKKCNGTTGKWDSSTNCDDTKEVCVYYNSTSVKCVNTTTATGRDLGYSCTTDSQCKSGKCAIMSDPLMSVCVNLSGTYYVCDRDHDTFWSEEWVNGKKGNKDTKCSYGCNNSTGKCRESTDTLRDYGIKCSTDADCKSSGKCVGEDIGLRVCIPKTGLYYVCDSQNYVYYSEKWENGNQIGAGIVCPFGCNYTTGKCRELTVTSPLPTIAQDQLTSGSPYNSNSSVCKNLNGVCATYSKKLISGNACIVNGYSKVGTVKTDLCKGDVYTVCCTGITGSSSSGGSTSGGSSSGGGNNGGGNNDTTVAVTGITLNPPSLSLKVGQSQAITATVAPADATDTTVTWSSDKATVAEVGSATGLVTAKGVGTAIITAKTSNNKTATASVTVVAASTTTTGSPKISFKFTLRGVKPSYIGKDGKAYDCFSKLGNLKVDVVNSPTNTYQTGLAATFAPVANEVNSKGDQVFKVTALALDGKFSSVSNFNYVKIKGPFHVKRRMCNDGQTSKIPETTVCDVSLMSDKVYDFTNYTLLAGDIDGDGIVNSIDYSVVKRNFNADADILCGREGDLNMDGVVNWIDGNLISKESLSSRDDE